tara:strand:- start:280 stop:882 length:603 start_codon:yes stop_codon:yes gene_type:complete
MVWRVAYICLLFLAACSSPTQDFENKLVPIGNFRLGQIVPRADAELTKGLLSRTASREEWAAAVHGAFKDRFSRFDGGSYYHLGITVSGYILAKPGIPLILAPKSVIIFTVIVLEDHTGKVLTEKPHQITVIEQLNVSSLLGSGYTRSREQQINNLAQQAALSTETWLRLQPWFEGPDTILELSNDVETDLVVVIESDTQ